MRTEGKISSFRIPKDDKFLSTTQQKILANTTFPAFGGKPTLFISLIVAVSPERSEDL
ncbi:hypothetical protein [Pedobacter suwonensis]|uniref:hypothetical protein n=1 Tax=Pedobacter suwonensis TaxID=332999 RepID=UPI0025DC47E5|nr:hypothetical protein [uncultured Pedobacter sp.]